MLKDIILFYEFACFQLPLSGSPNEKFEITDVKAPGDLKLSTPSLGITGYRLGSPGRVEYFQLPLSGSRVIADLYVFMNNYDLSTPSLGITTSSRTAEASCQIPSY